MKFDYNVDTTLSNKQWTKLLVVYRKRSLLRLYVHAYLWRLASYSEPAIQSAIQYVTTYTTGRRGQKGAAGIIFDIVENFFLKNNIGIM